MDRGPFRGYLAQIEEYNVDYYLQLHNDVFPFRVTELAPPRGLSGGGLVLLLLVRHPEKRRLSGGGGGTTEEFKFI